MHPTENLYDLASLQSVTSCKRERRHALWLAYTRARACAPPACSRAPRHGSISGRGCIPNSVRRSRFYCHPIGPVMEVDN